MKIHLRDGDELEIELPDGQVVSVLYEVPDMDPATLPQLEFNLPQRMTVNLWQEESNKVGHASAVQIVIPIEKKL